MNRLRARELARSPTGVASTWTLAGQAVTFGSLIVFAGLSGPRPVALLAAGSALVAVVNTFSTVGVELVLPVAPPRELLSLYRRGAVALAVSAIGSVIAGVPIAVALKQPSWIAVAAGVGVVAVALGQLISAALVRHRRVTVVGAYRFGSALLTALAQGIALAAMGARAPWALFAGYVAGSVVASLSLFGHVLRDLLAEVRAAAGPALAAPWRHLQAAAAAGLNIATLQGPAIIWPGVLGSSLAGQWSLVMRVAAAPVSLALGPLSNSIYADVADLIRGERRSELLPTLVKWRRRLLIYSLTSAAASAVVILVLPSVLGPAWGRMRFLLPLGLLFVVTQCVVTPMGELLNLISQSRTQLLWDAARLATIAVAIAIVANARGYAILLSYSLAMAIFYVILYRITTAAMAKFVSRAPS